MNEFFTQQVLFHKVIGRIDYCAWCGLIFGEHDTCRAVFSNYSGSPMTGNPLICAECDKHFAEITKLDNLKLRNNFLLLQLKFMLMEREEHAAKYRFVDEYRAKTDPIIAKNIANIFKIT